MTVGEGSRVGQWRVERRIGTGSMGSVWLAFDDAGSPIALKTLRRDAASDERALHRFEREARALGAIASPHVVRVLGSGVHEGETYLAMDLCDGPDLAAWVAGPSWNPDRAQRVVEALADALAASHRAGVVHRDFKPDNVIVETRAGEPFPRVLDFGIAKTLDSATWSSTREGLGAPLWTSPEQANPGWTPDPRADVWALGLCAFYVLTRQEYWLNARHGSLAELSLELLRGSIDPADARRSALGVATPLPADFDAWFERAVDRDPARRFPDAAAALAALPWLAPRARGTERSGVRTGRPGLLLLLLFATAAFTAAAIRWLVLSQRH